MEKYRFCSTSDEVKLAQWINDLSKQGYAICNAYGFLGFNCAVHCVWMVKL